MAGVFWFFGSLEDVGMFFLQMNAILRGDGLCVIEVCFLWRRGVGELAGRSFEELRDENVEVCGG